MTTIRKKGPVPKSAVIESENNPVFILDNAPDIIFSIDLLGNFLYMNKEGLNITGYTLKEIKKRNLLAVISPESQNKIKSLLKGIRISSRIPVFHLEIITPSKKRIPLEFKFKPIKEQSGRITALSGIARNISAQKTQASSSTAKPIQTEATWTRMKSILDNATNLSIMGLNKQGKIIFWNKLSEKLFGYQEKTILGKTPGEVFLSKEEEKRFQKNVRDTFQKKEPSKLQEITLTTKQGENKHVLASLLPAEPSDEEQIALATLLDISSRKRAEEKISEMTQQIEKFAEISADIIPLEDPDDLFENIAQAIVDYSDFNRVLISYFKDEPPYRDIISHKGAKKADLNRVKKIEMPREKYIQIFDRAISVGSQSCYIPHTMMDILDSRAVIPGEKKYPEKPDSWHQKDNLLVKMKDTKGNIIGIISVDDSKSGLVPTQETVRPLEIFANLISEVIQKLVLAQKIKESQQKYLDLFNNIKVGIFRASKKGEILEINPSAWEMLGYCGLGKPTSLNLADLNLKDLFFDPQDTYTFIAEMEKKGFIKNKEFQLRRMGSVPFWASVTSTIHSVDEGENVFYDTVIEDITRRKKLQEEVNRLSITDELTGLYNRRYFHMNLPREIQTAEKWRSALALIMVDIDDFKEYNDKYHHLKGDDLLKLLAQIISSNIRQDKERGWPISLDSDRCSTGDWAARFGGDEFIVVLPGTDAEKASVVAERLRKKFGNKILKPDKTPTNKTISLGISYCIYSEEDEPKKGSGPQIEPDYEKIATDLINLADKAMFTAKESGKNTYTLSKKFLTLKRVCK